MTRYRVGLAQTVTEQATLTIEADSFEEAERLALNMAFVGSVEWQYLDVFEPAEIVSVDEIAEPKSPDA